MPSESVLKENIQLLEGNIFSMREGTTATPASVDALFDELARRVENTAHFRLVVLASELAIPSPETRHQIQVRTQQFGDQLEAIAVVIGSNRPLRWVAQMLISRVIGSKGRLFANLDEALKELRK